MQSPALGTMAMAEIIDITVNFIANAAAFAVSSYHFVTLLFTCVLFVTNLAAPLTEIHLDCGEPADPDQLVPQIQPM